jgi:putative NADH-flavin reductase
MNVLVFGASGRTGREVIKQGIARGLTLTAFVRNPARFDIGDPNLRLAVGDVADRKSVEDAMPHQDAVICVLGGNSLIKREPAIVVGVHNIVSAMESAGVHRMIYLSADTVDETRKDLNAVRRALVPIIFHSSSADHELNEDIIRQSHLDWTIVRPPMLTNGARTGSYRIGEHLKAAALLPQISRADVADFMLDQVAHGGERRVAVEVMH